MLLLVLSFGLAAEVQADAQGAQAEAERVTSWVPRALASLHSEQWVRSFAESLAPRAREAGVSRLALRLTLGALPPSELPDDAEAAASFCFEMAFKADAALRSGYSPTLLASELRQVRRTGSDSPLGRGLAQAGRGNRPIVHGVWSAPAPAGGAPSSESGRPTPNGGGRGDTP